MFELATSSCLSPKSAAMVSCSCKRYKLNSPPLYMEMTRGTYQWRKGVPACRQQDQAVCSYQVHLPGPECYHETEPREEEHTSIDIDRIETRNRASFPIDRIDLWSSPQQRWVEHGEEIPEGQAASTTLLS